MTSYHKQIENQTKYIKCLFWEIGQPAVQDCKSQEKRNNISSTLKVLVIRTKPCWLIKLKRWRSMMKETGTTGSWRAEFCQGGKYVGKEKFQKSIQGCIAWYYAARVQSKISNIQVKKKQNCIWEIPRVYME